MKGATRVPLHLAAATALLAGAYAVQSSTLPTDGAAALVIVAGPGFTLFLALSPGRSLRAVEAATFATGLSLVVAGGIYALLQLFEARWAAATLHRADVGVSALLLAVAWIRWARLPEEARSSFRLPARVPSAGGFTALVSALLFVTVFAYAAIAPAPEVRTTTLTAFDVSGDPQYGHLVQANRTVGFLVTVENHEYRALDYVVVLWGSGPREAGTDLAQAPTEEGVLSRMDVRLAHNETARLPVSFTRPFDGPMEVGVFLYRRGEPEPYRRVNLLLDASSTGDG